MSTMVYTEQRALSPHETEFGGDHVVLFIHCMSQSKVDEKIAAVSDMSVEWTPGPVYHRSKIFCRKIISPTLF